VIGDLGAGWLRVEFKDGDEALLFRVGAVKVIDDCFWDIFEIIAYVTVREKKADKRRKHKKYLVALRSKKLV